MEDNNIQVKRTLEISEEDGMKSDEQKTGAESARESWRARIAAVATGRAAADRG